MTGLRAKRGLAWTAPGQAAWKAMPKKNSVSRWIQVDCDALRITRARRRKRQRWAAVVAGTDAQAAGSRPKNEFGSAIPRMVANHAQHAARIADGDHGGRHDVPVQIVDGRRAGGAGQRLAAGGG